MRVRWLRTALANLDAEAEYIAEDNLAAAGRTVQRILRAVNLLGKNPAMGRAGRVAGTRELVVAGTPYILPYRVRGEAVEILRVFHAARKWPEKLRRGRMEFRELKLENGKGKIENRWSQSAATRHYCSSFCMWTYCRSGSGSNFGFPSSLVCASPFRRYSKVVSMGCMEVTG